MKKGKSLSVILRIIICAVIIFIMYWFMLPPLNPRSYEMWSFLCLAVIVCVAVNALSSLSRFFGGIHVDQKRGIYIDDGRTHRQCLRDMGKPVIAALVSVAAVAVLSAVASLIGAQIFNASRYESLITISDGDFASDVAELSKTQIPVVDRDTASRLGQRKLGEMSDLVSQFEIQSNYTQINYNGRPVRVTPLTYGDPIKWLNNQSDGIPAYIMVDMTTQETSLIRLDKGMKYSSREYFMRRVDRYLRFKYPTKIFDNISFEIDDDGTPYWVASTVSYRIGIWSGRDIGGAVLLNAVTGESEYYDLADIPTWVDQVYSADMAIEQLTYNGKYRSGFWNSIFGQKGVLQPTDGYNYLAINDDVWLYTGMTSVTSDQSNVGFVLINLRTKETKFYSIPGAEEYSAMDSAQGQVQHLGYTATFPLLLNVSDRPTYFMSLKDAAGLVKMYAFVDVEQYQVVGTGNSVDAARADYIDKLRAEDVEVTESQQEVRSGTVAAVSSAVVEGNTKYYLRLSGDDNIYTADISLSDSLPFIGAGDYVELSLSTAGDNVAVTGVRVTAATVSDAQ